MFVLPSLSNSAPPLTVDTILTALQGANWKSLGENIFPRDLRTTIGEENIWFCPKVYEIQKIQPDEYRLRAVVECWVHGDGKWNEGLSWRRIIYELDRANETRIADTIRHFAEPIPGRVWTPSMFMCSEAERKILQNWCRPMHNTLVSRN